MSQQTLVKYPRGSVITPSSSASMAAFIDLDNLLKTKDNTGYVRSYQKNVATAQQSPVAATRTYINGSAVALAAAGALQVGSVFRWRLQFSKTAAGIATSTIDVAFGVLGTIADTARVSFTKPAGTANADTGIILVEATCRGPLNANGIFSGVISITHGLGTTGHMTQQIFDNVNISAGFDVTTPTFVGLCITTGAADVITIDSVVTEAWDV